MFLSNASIRRPVAMASLLIGLSFLGFNAYRTIQLEFLPKLDIPYVTVVTVYPGGSPEEIETDIAKRIGPKRLKDARATLEQMSAMVTEWLDHASASSAHDPDD